MRGMLEALDSGTLYVKTLERAYAMGQEILRPIQPNIEKSKGTGGRATENGSGALREEWESTSRVVTVPIQGIRVSHRHLNHLVPIEGRKAAHNVIGKRPIVSAICRQRKIDVRPIILDGVTYPKYVHESILSIERR